MKRDLNQLKENNFDLVIIGGGITGACLAHDAALRGLRTALVEKNDFGMSTSSASSKLLHGGIRYLQKLQFGKVRESARERTHFQVIAPHIIRSVPFLIPTVKGSLMKGRTALLAGMSLYRLLCTGLNRLISDPSKKIESGRYYPKDRVLVLSPHLKAVPDLTGAHSLIELHMNNSERMTLAFIKTAVANGAAAANHVKVTNLKTDSNTVVGVTCRDELSGEQFDISARLVVNAAGPFLPAINSEIEGLNLHKQTTGYSKGVHLVTRQIDCRYALALSSGKKTEGLVTRGGRHIFMIPWRGRTLIGTTNVPFDDDLDNVRVTQKDVTDFLQDINAILPGVALGEEDVHYAFAGLYPLTSEEIKKDTYQGTGEYQVVDHAAQKGPDGIISVLGAKYTTARAIAEQGMDLAVKKLNADSPACRTASEPLSEGRISALDRFIIEKQRQYGELLPPKAVYDLIVSHGSSIDRVISYLQEVPDGLEQISADRETLVGEIAYAVEHEMACTLDDVFFARTGLGTIGHPGDKIVRQVCDIMGRMLDWPDDRREQEIAAVEKRYHWGD